jgi:hypothetical protein
LTEDTGGGQGDRPPSNATEQQFQAVREFAETIQRDTIANQQVGRVQSLDPFDLLRRDHLAQRHALRDEFASNLKLLLVGQIVVADAVFIVYA